MAFTPKPSEWSCSLHKSAGANALVGSPELPAKNYSAKLFRRNAGSQNKFEHSRIDDPLRLYCLCRREFPDKGAKMCGYPSLQACYLLRRFVIMRYCNSCSDCSRNLPALTFPVQRRKLQKNACGLRATFFRHIDFFDRGARRLHLAPRRTYHAAL
jgi:hypothetical protein